MFKINFSGFLFLFSRVSAVLAFTLLNFQLIGHENYLQLDVLELVNDNKDAVVRVKAAFRQKDANEENASKINLRVGTGFFVSQEGHILVNASRALGADRIGVEYNGYHYPAEVIGHDPSTNVSLLRLLTKPDKFSVISIPQDHSTPLPGSFVISLSCPLDFSVSPNIGIISGIDKKLGDRMFPTAYLRSSISAGLGQAGGPVFDQNGQLVGMTILSIPEIGGSYILPTDALARVKEDLFSEGTSQRGWIGLEVKGNFSDKGEFNVFISELNKDGPAEKSGLKVGDKLISICDTPINHITDLPGAVFKSYIGKICPIKIEREGQEMDFSIKAISPIQIESNDKK